MSNNRYNIIIEKVFGSFKKITPFLIVIVVVSGWFYLPSNILEWLKLDRLPSCITSIIHLIFWMALVLIIVLACSSLTKLIIDKVKNKKAVNKLRDGYYRLNNKQKECVCNVLKESGYSLKVFGNSYDYNFLVDQGFLTRQQEATDPNTFEDYCVYSANKWLVDFYVEKPQVFETTGGLL